MSEDYFIVSDIGTSAVKTGLANIEGKILCDSLIEYQTIFKNNGIFVEQDPEEWWKAFKDSIKDVFNKSLISPKSVSAVSISGHTPSVLPVSKEGIPLRDAMIWMDRRGTKQCEDLKNMKNSIDIELITKNRIDPTYSISKILWLKDNEKDIFNKTYKFLQTNGYINYRLTGCFSIDITQCNLTQLYDIEKKDWSESICNHIGLEITRLPKIYNSTDILGYITEKSSIEIGFKKGIPVIAGSNDTAASSLGVGVIESGDSFFVMGQAGGIGFCTNTLPTNPIFMNYDYIFRDSWFTLAPMASFGASFRWARDNICDFSMGNNKSQPYKIMDDLIKDEEAGSKGIIFLPYMAGERAPIWNSFAKGVFFGLNLNSTKPKILRSILEGTSFAVKHNIENMEHENVVINDIVCTGGGSRSRVWNQILADITEKNIVITKNDEGVLIGNTILAALGTKKIGSESITKFIDKIVKIKEIYHPNEDKIDMYRKMFEVYKNVYKHLESDFKRVSEISI